jgi:hypothetical protein
LKAGRVASRSEPLEVDHSSAVELLQHEPAAAGLELGLDLPRDIDRRPSRDARACHSSNPNENRSA